MGKTFKTRCPHCGDIIYFDVDYILMNKFRDAIFFLCDKCETIFFTDTFGGDPIAYYDNEKIVDLREKGYDEEGVSIL